MSVGERGRRMQALQYATQTATGMMQAGMDGVLVNLDGIYQSVVDFLRLAGLPNADQYFVNPKSQESQQAAQQKAQQAQAAQQAQMQQAQQQMEFQYRLMTDMEKVKGEYRAQTEQLKGQLEAVKIQTDRLLRTRDQRIKMAEIEADIDQAEAQREIDRMQARAPQ
jgi:hypothetical protein